LAAAGVGRLGLIDADVVDVSNLQRQIIYSTDEVGKYKVDAASHRLRALNPHIEIEVWCERLTGANAERILRDYDLVIDGSDNFSTRYIINDACIHLKKPFVYGSVYRFEGQVALFEGEPCYRCLFPKKPSAEITPSCAEAGVLGVLPGVIGLLQATEAIQYIVGIGNRASGRLVTYDSLKLSFDEIVILKNPECSICGDLSVRKKPLFASEIKEIEPKELQEVLRNTKALLLDVRDRAEFERAHIEGAQLAPLSELKDQSNRWSKDATIVCYCHFGKRSLAAAELLQASGFTNAVSLRGGIDAWSSEMGHTVQRNLSGSNAR
jgi:adenylyltransferase/sulfurtransferase